jgi:hypothetical protein
MKKVLNEIKENKEFTFAVASSITLAIITVYNAVTFGIYNPF